MVDSEPGSNSPPLRVIFMGSPDFAVPVFEAVANAHEVVAVVSQPDRRAGRGRKLRPPPVKVSAQARGVEVLQPTAIKTAAFREALQAYRADVFVVAAYGRILTPALLEVPPKGCWNVHASLLPAWRGAAPIQWALIHGDAETGVTIMRMDAGMDTGDIALQRRIPIRDEDTVATLSTRLSALGAEAILEAIQRLQQGRLETTPQDHHRATRAPMLTKDDGHLDFRQPACEVACRTRGVDPWPGAHARLGTAPDAPRVKLFHPRLADPDAAGVGAPGELLCLDDHGLVVACGDGAVSFAELQLPGRKRLPAQAVLAGRSLQLGERLS